MAIDTVASVEEQRLQLEQNVAKLRKALHHWRTWDAEYEGLKEALQDVPENAGELQLLALSEDFGGELVDENEIQDLLGLKKPPLRSPRRVINLVERRQDYVQSNIQTISKRLSGAEQVLAKRDHDDDEEGLPPSQGLPVTEITEELDDDGNVISSKISQPEDSTTHIVDALRKAGITDLGEVTNGQKANETNSEEQPEAETVGSSRLSSHLPVESPRTERPSQRKKSVSFSEDTKPPAASTAISHSAKEPSEPQNEHVPGLSEPGDETSTSSEVLLPGSRVVNAPVDPTLLNGSFGSGARVYELDDDDEVVGATAIVPQNESAEDARIRREMLQYSLNEVGPIVAELDLEEANSDDAIEDDLLDQLEDGDTSIYGDTSDEEEDDYGRSTKKAITDDYREQMLELEDRLRQRVIGNLGPDADLDERIGDGDTDTENDDDDADAKYGIPDVHRLVVRKSEDEDTRSAADHPGRESVGNKKSVRFAEELDIQPAPSPAKASTAAPLSDSIQQKSVAPPSSPAAGITNNPKPSKFKQRLEAQKDQTTTPQPPVPAFNSDQILTEKVAERPTGPKPAPSAPSNDGYDPELQQRQLASEYYRLRNGMIRQQGGFKPSEDEVDEPLMEEVDGKTKKVSRFKAARMKY